MKLTRKKNKQELSLLEEYQESIQIQKSVLGEVEFNDPNLTEKQRNFLKALYSVYPNEAKALQIAGVSLQTLAKWKKDLVFSEYYNIIEDFYKKALESVGFRRALAGSDDLLKFMLSNLNPDKYKKPDRQEIIIRQTIEETNNILKRIDKIEALEVEYNEPNERAKDRDTEKG